MSTWGLSVLTTFLLGSRRAVPDTTSHHATIASLCILSKSLYITHPAIGVAQPQILTASLNKQQISNLKIAVFLTYYYCSDVGPQRNLAY
jgi:hypothetical protein